MEEDVQAQENPTLVRKIEEVPAHPPFKEIIVPALVILVIIMAGVVTGYFAVKREGSKIIPSTVKQLAGGAEEIIGPKEIGIKDTRTFRDTAIGKIKVNDNADVPEGSHKLLRPGGPSQVAFLTSSVVDLNKFLDKCVQVWGETYAAQKAGWLMDVGRVKILDSCPEGI